MNVYILILFCMCVLFAQHDCAFVRLFSLPDFKGESFGVTMSYANRECVSLPPPFQNNVESINTNSLCVEIFSQKDCVGTKIVIYPGTLHHDLEYWNFHDKTMSLKPCNEHIDWKQSNTNTVLFNDGENYPRYMNVDYCENIPSDYSASRIVNINEHKTCFKYFQMANCQGPEMRFRKNILGNVVNQPGLTSIASIGRCTSGGINMAFSTSTTTVYPQRINDRKADNYNGSNNDGSSSIAATVWIIGSIAFVILLSGVAVWFFINKRGRQIIRYVRPNSYE